MIESNTNETAWGEKECLKEIKLSKSDMQNMTEKRKQDHQNTWKDKQP